MYGSTKIIIINQFISIGYPEVFVGFCVIFTVDNNAMKPINVLITTSQNLITGIYNNEIKPLVRTG